MSGATEQIRGCFKMNFGIASFAAIVAICYLVGLGVKTSPIDDKWIPTIVGVFGLVLGLVAYFLKVPDFPANDILTAAAVGVVSGLASTGINQVAKQLTKN